MTKRALIVGVGKYPKPADSLDAPAREVEYWKDLLSDEYGFGNNVVPMVDEEAVRLDVLNKLREQLKLTTQNDHFVLVLCGHGGETRGWITDTETNDQTELAFISYLENGYDGFQEAAITPSDIARILRDEIDLPASARFTLIAEFCHSGQFANGVKPINDLGPREVNPKILFIPNAVPGLPSGAVARTFMDLDAMIADRSNVMLLILAASGSKQPAQEVGDETDRRMLFSREAIRHLELAAADESPISSKTLILKVNPLGQNQSAIYVPQVEPGPAEEDFAGGFNAGATSSVALPALGRAGAKTKPGKTKVQAGSIDIQIFGIGTLINLPAKFEPFRNRWVFPYDWYADTEEKKHRAFVEVADLDMSAAPTVGADRHYMRAGVMYSSWRLTQHVVRIPNAFDNGKPIYRTQDYKDYVPSMLQVTPELPYEPRQECFNASPPPDLFTGFFDVQSGNITIGELEKDATTFKRQYAQTETRPAKRTPICVRLNVPLQHESGVIVIAGPKPPYASIFVKSGSTIIIGNAREEDLGPTSSDGKPEQFLIYYNLAASPPPPPDPGLPYRNAVTINACTVTNWP